VRSLMNCKLFWVPQGAGNEEDISQAAAHLVEATESWTPQETAHWKSHSQQRVSVNDILGKFSMEDELRHKSLVQAELDRTHIRWILQSGEPHSVLPALRRQGTENWDGLLHFLDEIALTSDPDQVPRVLVSLALNLQKGIPGFNVFCFFPQASISEVLALMASREGGLLRSGPAGNQRWREAFDHLTNTRLKEGVREMAQERKAWMARLAFS